MHTWILFLSLSTDSWQPKVVHLPFSQSPLPSTIEPPKLDDFQGHQLGSILQEHKEAISWTIADVKGISPFVVMHRIHLEEIAKASQHVFDLRKLQSHWTSPFIICIIYLQGIVEVWMVLFIRIDLQLCQIFLQKIKNKNSSLFSAFRFIFVFIFLFSFIFFCSS